MKVHTVCNRDCPDTCGLIATAQDNQLLRVEGDPDHPITRGIVCARTQRFQNRQHDPARLQTPLLRTSTGFREASWQEAITFIADGLIQPRPGCDFELARAVAALLLKRGIFTDIDTFTDNAGDYRTMLRSRTTRAWARSADVSDDQVDLLASVLADRPSATLLRWGMARRLRGGAIVRAIDTLCAASGNVGIAGGGVSYRSAKLGAFASLEDLPPPSRSIPEPQLGRYLLDTQDPPVRGVWITSGNPVVMLPDSHAVQDGLRGCEWVVVVDTFMTDTALCATMVLPTTTLFEDDGLLASYGYQWMGASQPVLKPPSGVRTDLQIVQKLAAEIDGRRNLGVRVISDHLAGSAKDWKRKLAQPLLAQLA
ncbi:MAG: hypothetical protein CSA75_03655, partial [Sorangium cellulosum]